MNGGTRLVTLVAGLIAVSVVALAGCNGTEGPSLPPPSGEFPSLGLRFDVPSEVKLGEDVPFRLTVTNVGDQPLELGLGGHDINSKPGSLDFYRGASGFFITSGDGNEVTCKLCAGRIAAGSLSFLTLQPGEELDLGWGWDQTDNDLQPVPPGTYSVYGTFTALDVARNEEKIELRTETREFTIEP